jgi:hypothetical protein
MRNGQRRNPCQELCVHGTIPASPTRPAQKAEMPTIARTDHLHIGRQGDAIEHVCINQGIVSRKEDMTGNSQTRYERGGTALAVVIERISKTA